MGEKTRNIMAILNVLQQCGKKSRTFSLSVLPYLTKTKLPAHTYLAREQALRRAGHIGGTIILNLPFHNLLFSLG